VVQQLEKPDRRTKFMFVEQPTWQCPTIVADDGPQLRPVHSLQPTIEEQGHATTCRGKANFRRGMDSTVTQKDGILHNTIHFTKYNKTQLLLRSLLNNTKIKQLYSIFKI